MRIALTLLIPLALAPALARADGLLSTSAACSGGSIVVSWLYEESTPVGSPEWVGLDVYRHGTDPCDAPVRLNAEVIPRPSNYATGQFVDPSPSAMTAYVYELVPVDQNRQPVTVTDCDCHGFAVVTCPSHQTAVARGTLEDAGWAMFVHACPGNCSPVVFTESQLDALRPYAQAGTPLALYGTVSCTGFEGCSLVLDHFEVADCVPVPALSVSWGSLKARYH